MADELLKNRFVGRFWATKYALQSSKYKLLLICKLRACRLNADARFYRLVC